MKVLGSVVAWVALEWLVRYLYVQSACLFCMCTVKNSDHSTLKVKYPYSDNKNTATSHSSLYHIWQNVCRGKLLWFFTQPQIFLWIMGLLISNISLEKCHSKSFTANRYFPLKTWKFPPVDVFPLWYMPSN